MQLADSVRISPRVLNCASASCSRSAGENGCPCRFTAAALSRSVPGPKRRSEACKHDRRNDPLAALRATDPTALRRLSIGAVGRGSVPRLAIAVAQPRAPWPSSLLLATRRCQPKTLFERLEAHGRTWKVYVQEPMSFSAAALIHMSRLQDRLATHFAPFSEFEDDVANGALPDFSMIEPNLIMGHNDYHPAVSRALGPGVELPLDPPSSILGGEAFLARIYTAIRSAASTEGSNAYNTTFFIGWDEPGGTYDHVPPGARAATGPERTRGTIGLHI